jgi:hypothetical protein
MRAMASLVVVGISVVACSGGSGSIGAPCSGQSQCSGLSTGNSVGFCNQLGVCTRDCTAHADCGCAAGTTNGDLANGKCGYSCVNVGTAAVCAKICANNAQCAGTTTCQPAVDSTTQAPLGYSDCL